MAGKGDTPRPVDREKYDANYDRIFRKPAVKVEASKEKKGKGEK